MTVSRGFRCTDLKSCCPFWTIGCIDCGQLVDVTNESGQKIGYVKEDNCNHCMNGGITAYNEKDEPLFSVKASLLTVMCTQCCCKDTEFEMKDTKDATIGMLKRKWKCRGCVADLDDFNVKFTTMTSASGEIDVTYKKIAIAMMVFIKYAWFEE